MNNSLFPTNIEILVLMVGRQTDFLKESSYLCLAKQFLEQKKPTELDSFTFTKFSDFINDDVLTDDDQPRSRKVQTEKMICEMFDKFDFKDIGDTQQMIVPVLFLNRFMDQSQMTQYLENQVKDKFNSELYARVQILKKIELKKEARLKNSLGEAYKAFQPYDLEGYCYLRALAFCYFNWLTTFIDINKQTHYIAVELLSSIKPIFPSGNAVEKLVQHTWEEVEENIAYLSPDQRKLFLQHMNISDDDLKRRLAEEQKIGNLGSGGGIIAPIFQVKDEEKEEIKPTETIPDQGIDNIDKVD